MGVLVLGLGPGAGCGGGGLQWSEAVGVTKQRLVRFSRCEPAVVTHVALCCGKQEASTTIIGFSRIHVNGVDVVP